MEKTLLVMKQIDDQLAISLTCDREELLCGLARIILAVGVQEAQKDGKNDFDAYMEAAKEFTLDIPRYIYKELSENDLDVR